MRISDWSSDVCSSDLSGKLDANLVDKLDQVRSVFEYGFETSSPDVRLVGRTQLLDVGTFTITDPGGAIDGTNLQVDRVDAFSVQGSTLKGLAGTIRSEEHTSELQSLMCISYPVFSFKQQQPQPP